MTIMTSVVHLHCCRNSFLFTWPLLNSDFDYMGFPLLKPVVILYHKKGLIFLASH